MIAKQAVPANSGQDEWAGLSTGIWDRSLSNNPFKDWSWVYIPYCTGDLHTGSTTKVFPTTQMTGHFAGRQNLALDLAQIVPSFPSVSHVVLSGSSAGSVGALINYDFVAQAFGGVRVDLVDDSAPIFPNPLWPGVGLSVMFSAWNTSAAMPADCPQCSHDAANLYGFLSQKYPASRFALTDHDSDATVAPLYLMGPGPAPAPVRSFYFSLGDFTNNELAPLPNWRYYVSSSSVHTLLWAISESSVNTHCTWHFRLGWPVVPATCLPHSPPIAPTTVELADWLTQMESDDPSWQSASSIEAY
jgi:hypothetical protein